MLGFSAHWVFRAGTGRVRRGHVTGGNAGNLRWVPHSVGVMTETRLLGWDSWKGPLLQARDRAPAGTLLTILTGDVSWGSASMRINDDGVGREHERLRESHRDDTLLGQISDLAKDLGEGDAYAYEAVVNASGDGAVTFWDLGGAAEGELASVALVDGALPKPWRRQPAPVDGQVAGSVDLAALETALRARLKDPVGATSAEIAAFEDRLGVPLPAELRVLYRLAGRGEYTSADVPDYETYYDEDSDQPDFDEENWVGFRIMPFDAGWRERHHPGGRAPWWRYNATTAPVTLPTDRVQQGIVWSPGWIVFGDDWGRNQYAIDTTPGPAGMVGQVICIPRHPDTGAEVVADSLTDWIVRHRRQDLDQPSADVRDDLPRVAFCGGKHNYTPEQAANPDLEVISINWGRFDIAPLAGLHNLRTLRAQQGTLVDPLQIADVPSLEFLSLGIRDWRALLDAGLVPATLLAAHVDELSATHAEVVGVINRLLALWSKPPIPATVINGNVFDSR